MKVFRVVGFFVVSVFLLGSFLFLSSCGGGDPEPTSPPITPEPDPITITVNPASVKQEMVGFGGALTWYCNWMTQSSKKNEIADLIFTDLGIDIIRFKNWYYPDDYPAVKTTDVMTDDYAKAPWDATNELYTLAKNRNANVKTLLSSWGPPKSLKDNNSSREGTLKKDAGVFMYDAFADYWVDILDHVPFDPDYISIQNEPTYTNSGWTTCKWGAVESATLPDYNIAFDKVYDKIKDRTHVPIMIGPESQDVPTYSAFANVLKNKAHCGMFAYHPYNINSGTSSDQIVSSLKVIGNISDKPNIMTEFSDNLNWYNTALFIHNSLVHANSSGYIYWKLVWATPGSGTDAGMISISESDKSKYVVTPFYYLIKHFSKNIDAGYHRVETTSSNSSLLSTAFISPDNTKLTLIIINNGSTTLEVNMSATGKTISSVKADQSKDGSYYKALTISSPTAPVSLPAKSITTVVFGI